MSIKEFIDDLAAKDLFLVVEDDKLILRAKKKKQANDTTANAGKTPEVINYIKANKEALKQYILSAGNARPSAPHKNITAICKLSPLQAGMLFHGLYERDTLAYMEQFSCRCGHIDPDTFARGWQVLIERHSILRTGFFIDAFNIPVQCVQDKVVMPLHVEDCRTLDTAGKEKAIQARKRTDQQQQFNFEQAPLMRISLLQLEDQQWQMLWTYHHLLVDGWSMQLLIQEFLSVYETLLESKPLPRVREDKYEDYIRYIERQDEVAEEDFWRNYMAGVDSATLLPFIESSADRNKTVEAFNVQRILLDDKQTRVLQSWAQRQHVTINTVIQGVWALLLHAYTGNDHVAYGVTVSGRPDDLDNVEDRVGIYTNLNPLHSVLVNEQPIAGWLQNIQRQQLRSREFQYTPINEIQRWIGISGDWFDSILTFENYPLSEMVASRKWALQIETVEKYEQTTNYPMSIRVIPGKETDIQFVYKSSLLSAEWVTRICSHFRNVLFTLMEESVTTVGELRLLGEKDREALISGFSRGEQVPVPADATILDLFTAEVSATPGSPAVVFEDKTLTYQELDQQSSRLAHHLLSLGVQREDRIPVCMERCADFIISIFAILKAGAVYVPVDPAYPAERIDFMLRDTAASIVLTIDADSVLLPPPLIKVIPADILFGKAPAMLPILPSPEPGHVAYIIYTSGSTGMPKGVMIRHNSLLHSVYARKHCYGATGNAFLVPSFSFDSSIAVIFGTLLFGGQLTICGDELLKDASFLGAVLPATDMLLCVPSYYQFLLEEGLLGGSGLQQVILAGERLELSLAIKHYEVLPGTILYNEYGPTETTVWATVSRIEKGDTRVTIGKPIANTEVYILDAWGNLQPPGVPGELYIGGPQLAQGYLNHPELTAEKFVADAVHPGSNKRLYRTHDVVRWLPDGNIEFLGRADDQVKIRGYRVEPGEIEAVLHDTPGIRQAVVLAATNTQGNQQLLAFIVCPGVFDREAIRQHLKTRLPDYMVPGLIVPLDAIPLTPNGKTDKKKLLSLDISKERAYRYVAPVTDTEHALVQVWQSLLGLERVGIEDDFFELGGHSLSAMRLVAVIRRQWNVDIPIRQVFDNATIARLAPLLQAGTKAAMPGITKRPGGVPMVLSFAQERLWFIHHLQGSTQYHLPWVFRLTGAPVTATLEAAFRAILTRHEVLRTAIREREGVGYPHLLDTAGWQMEIHSMDTAGSDEIDTATEAWLQQPFDLSKDYMLKVRLTTCSTGEYQLAILVHHIAFDGWSVGVMVDELMTLYNEAAGAQPQNLPALPIQYADYAHWQRTFFTGESMAAQVQYWAAQLAGVTPLDIYTDHPRPSHQSIRGAQLYRQLSPELSEGIQQLSLREGTTPFMTLLSAINILLYRYSGQEDICIGSPIAGRHYQELEKLAGFFVNTLPLRNRLEGGESFLHLLHEVKQSTLLAYEYQDLPFEKMVDALNLPRDPARHPVFQVVFSLHNMHPAGALQLNGVQCESLSMERVTTPFDLNFDLTLTAEGIQVALTYCTDLFTEERMNSLLDHYSYMLEKIVGNPAVIIDQLPLLSPAQEAAQLLSLNKPPAGEAYSGNAAACFEEQAKQTPNSIALVFGENRWTYQDLDAQSNQVGHYLRSIGIYKEQPIPVAMDRSGLLIITLLGILKAGGAYVPIDPSYPSGRITYMLEDIGTSILLTDKAHAAIEGIADTVQVIPISMENEEIASQPVTPLSTHIPAGALAYIMYTSGSTGTPKGVMAEHRNIVSLVKEVKYMPLQQGDVLLATGSPSFDAITFEYWGMLLNGGCLVMCSHETLLDTAALQTIVKRESVNKMWFTAGWFNQLTETTPALFETLDTIIVGGDRLSVHHIRQLQQHCPALTIINGYGPTENTTFSLTHTIAAGDDTTDIPIGRAIDHRSAYVLDQQGRLCPAGARGELYVGGAGLTRGYWKQDALTASKFIMTSAFGRLYCTGDMAILQPDGNILFRGRRDEQVKIRGFRVEPGEIEATIMQAVGVQQAAVIVTAGADESKRLTAFVVPKNGYTKTTLLRYLHDHLPAYMIPQVVETTIIPLTENGKVDRNALAAQSLPADDDTGSTGFTPPSTPTELKLAEIWQTLLGVPRIGIHDNFFEKGGHSIMAMRLVGSIQKHLNKELPIREIFDHPTIAGLAAVLSNHTVDAVPLLPCHTPGTPAPLSFSQERLWFIDQLQGSVQYHMSWLFRLTGTLNSHALEAAFQAIIQRHEILRTVIREEDGVGRQYILAAEGWQMEDTSASIIADQFDCSADGYIKGLSQTPFDLSKDYMLKVTLIRVSEQEHQLFALFHHIAFDGWSISIMVDELIALYNGFVNAEADSLPPLPIQYADYAVWQREYLSGNRLETKLAYWKDKLAGIQPINLPLDYPRPVVQSTKGQSLPFLLDATLAGKIEQWSQVQGVTPFMTLLTAFKILLYRYTGQDDIAVGTPAANRMQPATASLIGFFVNTLVLRDILNGESDATSLLQQVKQTALEAYSHQDTPFEKIVEAVATERSMNNTPLFQVLFALQNTPDVKALDFSGLTFSASPFETGTSKFDLYFDFTRRPDGLYVQVQYCSDLFDPATIHRMFAHYRQLLLAMLANPAQKISKLEMLTAGEQKQLHDFNDTAIDYPGAHNIIGLFEEQVRLSPGKSALVMNGEPFSYDGLNQQANGLAHRLLTAGVRPGNRVIICMDRSAGMIAAVLAVLKAGATCVPIDPRYPADRIEFMMQDAGAAAIITSMSAYETVKARPGTPIILVSITHHTDELSHLNNPGIYVSGILYLIYTSGSTGKPKGVLLPEKALRNLLHWQHRLDVNQPGERILQFASINFDVSFQEIFSALCFGNTLCLVDEDQRKDMHELSGLIRRENITQLFVPYVVLKNLAEYAAEAAFYPHTLRAIFTAGEQLRLTDDIQQLMRETGLRLFNQYGPSEAHVVSAYEVQTADFAQRPLPPIGKPVANTQLHITDTAGNPCGIGTTGELYIAGVQVAAGYLNQPALTADRFVADHFSRQPGAVMYRTGDKARWLPDGNIEFLGRFDDQVKIRGFRVEPGEIETVLQQAPGIKQAIVIVRYDRHQQPVLVAYLRSDGAVDKNAVQHFLAQQLPQYMIPAVMIPIDKVPLTANGKIDKRKLPEADIAQVSTRSYTAPRNETEEKIVAIWQELLGTSQTGVHDNFFESGGHSLLVTRMNAAIRKTFGIELSVRILFQLTTPADIAAYIDLQQREVAADSNDYETIQL